MKLNIEELAREAGISADRREVLVGLNEQLEAFASLIVERCAVAADSSKDGGDDRGIERDVYIWNKAVNHATRSIRNLLEAE